MRTRRGLGMILHAKQLFDVSDRPSQVWSLRFTWVILTPLSLRLSMSTQNPWFWEVIAMCAGIQIFYRMVRAAMAEFELIGFRAQRKTENLMAEAYAKDRDFADKLPYRFNGIRNGSRIARTIRQEKPRRAFAP